METELKLLTSPDWVHLLAVTHPLQSLVPRVRHLENRYFDTPDHQLSANRMALRLRQADGAWEQTLKGAGQTDGGLHQRPEWEMAVRGPELELGRLPADSLPDGLRSDALMLLFQTDFRRTEWTLQHADSLVELVVDEGWVVAGSARSPLCEIELELVTGDASALFDLAERIAREVPVIPTALNKAERGYRLLAGATDWPVLAGQAHTRVSELISLLARQIEALPDSSDDLSTTLGALVDGEILHVGLASPIRQSLQAGRVSDWSRLPNVHRLGHWLLHALRQDSL